MSALQPGTAWPQGLLLTYYGDDFTGSTDAMEAMTAAGVPTVLFLQPPTPAMLARYPDVRCIGLAGSSRGRSPDWMDRELPVALGSLAALNAPILQYKVCSTFDSSPEVGSIGRAIDIGTRLMPGRWAPMIVGAPRLRRYQAFGNLFAGVDGVGHRLDRHPTMSRHPVTPMHEADLRVHLKAQTGRRIELIDLVQLRLDSAARQAVELTCRPCCWTCSTRKRCWPPAGWCGRNGGRGSSVPRRQACSTRWLRTGERRGCCRSSRPCPRQPPCR
jgi:uncharacterized protein YgbK (DUF1537 family)